MSSMGQRSISEGVSFDIASLLADELRTPIVQARHALQLARLEGDMSLITTAEQCLSQSALLLERFLSSGEIMHSQSVLPLETLTIGAVMEEAAHRSSSLARLYNTELVVDYRTAKKPISGHKESLINILEHIAACFLQYAPKQLVLGTRVSKDGLRAGVYGEAETASQLFSSVQNLIAGKDIHTAQPGLAHLLVAHRIGSKHGIAMSAGRRSSLKGLSMTVPWSRQLNLLEYKPLS